MTSQDTPPAGGPGGSPPSVEELAGEFAHFKVHELLGYGGMGAVYRAEQESMGRMVALKVLLAPGGIAKDLGERFGREARAMAKLSHANIVQVFGLGETTSGRPYFVMEYVEGGTLRELVKQGPVEPGRAMEIVGEVCDALQYAHAKGIVHRDIKPGNILLGAGGRVKVSDFGLAKILGHEETQMKLTRTGGAMGTHGYIAPEQMESGSVIDGRADIYSVGVTLYEMLTGELPRGAFRPPSALVAGLDRRVDDIVVRAMLAEPSQRYQNISEIRSSLEFVRDDESGELPLPEAGSGGASDAWQPPGRIASTPPSAVTRERGKAWLMAGVAVLVLGGAGVFFVPRLLEKEMPLEVIDVAEVSAGVAERSEGPVAAEGAGEPEVAAATAEPASPLPLLGAERPTAFPLSRPGLPGKVVFWPDSSFARTDYTGTVADIPAGLDEVVAIEVDHGYQDTPRPSHAVALKSDGSVVAWGENEFGQTDVPENLTDVVAIAAGRDHNLALRADGTVVAWGRNDLGECDVPEDLDEAIAIAAGGQHSLALKADGTVVAWGSSSQGRTNVPSDLEDVVAISANGRHSLALERDGRVVAWGENKKGTCDVPPGLSDVVGVLGTEELSFALREDGSVHAWGGGIPARDFRIPGPILELQEPRKATGHLFRNSDGSWGLLTVTSRLDVEKVTREPYETPIDGLEALRRTIEGTFAILPAALAGEIDSPLLALPEPPPTGMPIPQFPHEAIEIAAGEAAATGRYVRIELHSATVPLTLAEVEVYAGGENVARAGTATQSTIAYDGVPGRAIDGNRDGQFNLRGQTHTAEGVHPDRNPWWELDLGDEVPIERILVFNRRDGSYHERLEGFALKILDADRNEVYASEDNPGQREPLAFLFGAPSAEMLASLKASVDAATAAADRANTARSRALAMAARDPADPLPFGGLVGEYFEGKNFGKLLLRRNDPAIDFDWMQDSPGPGVPAGGFSVRWTGTVVPKFTETYTFHAITDDGVRLWAGDPAGTPESTAPKPLFESGLIGLETPGHAIAIDVPVSAEAGRLYLVVDKFGKDNAEDHAAWAEPRFVMEDGSETRLTDLEWQSATQGWKEVQKNLNVDGKPFLIDGVPVEDGIGTHADSLIVYDIPETAVRFVARGGLCARPEFRWSSVQFFVLNTTDAGFDAWQNSRIGAPLVDAWHDHAASELTGSLPFVASRPVHLRMEYYQGSGKAVARLEWSSPSQSREVVPFERTDLLAPSPPIAAPSPVLTALPPGESVDLLALIDPDKHTLTGSWIRTASGALEPVADGVRSPSVAAPFEIDGGYLLEARFTPLETSDSTNFILPVEGRMISIILGGFPNREDGPLSGVSSIGGIMADKNSTSVARFAFEPGRTYSLFVRVETNAEETTLDITLDGASFIHWTGPTNDLSQGSPNLEHLPPRRIALLNRGAARSRFDTLTLTPLDGSARLVDTPGHPLAPTPPATELDGQLAALEVGFREKYRQAVLPGYVAGVAALEEKYGGALERGRLAAVEAGNLKLAILYRDELRRLEGKGPLPEALPASADEGFRTLVEAYLEKHGALEAVRETQAAPLLRAYEESLLKLEEAQKEESEAVRVRAVREALGSEAFWEGM